MSAKAVATGRMSDGRKRLLTGWPVARSVVGLSLISALVACQADNGIGVGETAYPSLYSVPDAPRPSLSVDERRQIVRELIDEHDRNREDTATVRTRSGLETSEQSGLVAAEAGAEDVIPDAPEGGNEAFRLRSTSKVPADSVYRGDAEIEDGSLDDFIRQLQRDTRTPAPATEDEPAAEELSETDEISALFEPVVDVVGLRLGEEPLYWISAFAPARFQHPPGMGDPVILLAAADDEPGVLCRYFGWAVAWSTMCLAEADVVSSEEDEPVGADLEQELRDAGRGNSGSGEFGSDETSGRPTGSSSPDGEPGRDGLERRLSEEDAGEAIEDAGRSVLAPVNSMLDRLRNDLDERRQSRQQAAPPPERARSSPQPIAPGRTAAPDQPPLPQSRPERREDITVVDQGESFDFFRTPRPAFKPTPDLPVILPPANQQSAVQRTRRRPDPPPTPAIRPSPPPADRDDDGAAPAISEALEPSDEKSDDGAVALALAAEARVGAGVDAAASPTLAIPPVEAADPPEATIILFKEDRPGLPEGANRELMTLLVDAKARDRKIHIIGEASTNHLARRRATDVGAVLVQLGATVEILEYDHQVIAGTDQVRLVLRPDPS